MNECYGVEQRAIGKPKDGQKHGFGRALAGARMSIFRKILRPSG